MTDLNFDIVPDEKVGSGLMLSPATPELLSAAVRLAELLFSPETLATWHPSPNASCSTDSLLAHKAKKCRRSPTPIAICSGSTGR